MQSCWLAVRLRAHLVMELSRASSAPTSLLWQLLQVGPQDMELLSQREWGHRVLLGQLTDRPAL